MTKVGFLSDDKKLGTLDQQRKAIGPVEVEVLPDEADELLSGPMLRDGDILVIAHARALGRFKSGFDLREKYLRRFSAMNVAVQIGADGIAEIYDEAAKVAAFHAAALAPTGVASPKQKKNPGRPKTYRKPDGDKLAMALEWWAGPLHWSDVGKLIGQMMGTKPVSRATLNAWFGNRPDCENRWRKPRSDKKS